MHVDLGNGPVIEYHSPIFSLWLVLRISGLSAGQVGALGAVRAPAVLVPQRLVPLGLGHQPGGRRSGKS